MFHWSAHRFSGGVLALDLANTVVWSDIDGRRVDRFADRALIAEFAEAASRFRRDELRDVTLIAPKTDADIRNLLRLRDTIDAWLRPDGAGLALQHVFDACAKASVTNSKRDAALSLGEACSRSAMRFLHDETRNRLKVCPSCRWLYLDNSKNQSRQWCDMKVCGNRAKARSFYARQKRSALGALNDT